MMKEIAVGTEDFKELIEGNIFYVDKTKFIEEVVSDKTKVKLFTRPRRFGKTLNMSMLKYFLDLENAEENRKLFEGLYIENSPKFSEQGKYPVIFISMKDLEGDTFEEFIDELNTEISQLFDSYNFSKEDFTANDLKIYNEIVTGEKKKYKGTLKFLTKLLHKQYDKTVMLLIDEYDAPLLSAYKNGYYDEAVKFFRGFYGSALKGNTNLKMAVLTGITKVSQTGIFSGLNNIETYTILNDTYDEYFGFIESEVLEALKDYEMQDTIEDMKFWYNGYRFGNTEVYNPWSIISYLKHKKLASYWGKTSGDFKIKEYLRYIGKTFLDDLEALLNGKTITVTVSEDTPLNDSNMTEGNFWQLMLFAGYLTTVEMKSEDRYEVRLPNGEVRSFFKKKFIEIIFESTEKFNRILKFLEEKKIPEIIEEIKENLVSIVSCIDVAKTYENAYHMFCAGMMSGAKASFIIESNEETGDGFSDLTLKAREPKKYPSYIFEFKRKGESSSSLEKLAKEGLKQIYDKRYDTKLLAAGIPAESIVKIGIAFDGKKAEAVYVDGIKE